MADGHVPEGNVLLNKGNKRGICINDLTLQVGGGGLDYVDIAFWISAAFSMQVVTQVFAIKNNRRTPHWARTMCSADTCNMHESKA